MDSSEVALCDMATLEEAIDQGEEADPTGDWEGNGLHLGLQWTRCLVELWKGAYELGLSRQMVC